MTAVFVDTNVFVYARDKTDAGKQAAAAEWLSRLWQSHAGRLSYQVLQEFYVTVTERLDPGMSKTEAQDDIRALSTWRPVSIDNTVIEGAWSVQDQFKYSWWDSLIISAAQVARCDYLLTEDMNAGQRVAELRIVNPFDTAPDELPL